MLTDREGRFLTQREFPRMATIRVVVDDALYVTADDTLAMRIELEPRPDHVKASGEQVTAECAEEKRCKEQTATKATAQR